MKKYSIFIFLSALQAFAMHNGPSDEPSAPPATPGLYPPPPCVPIPLMPGSTALTSGSTEPTTIGLKPNANIDVILSNTRIVVLPAYHQLLTMLRSKSPLSEIDAKAGENVVSAIMSFFKTYFVTSPLAPKIEKSLFNHRLQHAPEEIVGSLTLAGVYVFFIS